MAEMTVDYMKKRFAEIVGWPYVSPGTNDRNGIDCSGAFVRAYKMAGKSIYHGSNRIERVYCRDCFDLHGSASGLKEGMAIFKYREPNEDGYGLPQDYRAGGKYYNGDERDYTHIGLVTSVKPLGITNATSPTARVDTKIGSGIHSWRRAGYLKAVIYSTETMQDTDQDVPDGGENMSEFVGKTCVLKADGNDSPINLRAKKNTASALVAKIPQGDPVLCESDDGTWAYIRWDDVGGGKTYKGYVLSKFLRLSDSGAGDGEEDDGESDGKPSNEPENGANSPYCVCLYCDTMEEAETIVRVMKKATVEAG